MAEIQEVWLIDTGAYEQNGVVVAYTSKERAIAAAREYNTNLKAADYQGMESWAGCSNCPLDPPDNVVYVPDFKWERPDV